MASPTRTPPPPPPAVEPIAPSSPSPEHPPAKPSSDGSLPPENLAPAPPSPPPPPTTPPPPPPGDSSPSSTTYPSPPHPPPPPPLSADASPPLTPSADASPPFPQQRQASPPRPQPPPPPAPVSPHTPAPASSEAKSEQEAAEAESASESRSMTLAVVLAQTEDSTPQKASSAEPSPTGSPQKESAVTIAKLLSGEAPAAAAEGKATPDKVTPPRDTGSLAAAAVVTPVGGGGVGGGVGSKRWLLDRVPEKVRRAELRRAELGFRVSAAVFCLVALSVMAADTTTGWSGDSFRRYNEYRYVLAASVMAFTYSGFQLVAEVHYLVTGRRIIRAPFRSYFNLAMDQMLAYLLLSASSAALSRNDVWMSRFGGDQFTKLINASASMAFLAFIALGLNSVISAYCVFSLVS